MFVLDNNTPDVVDTEFISNVFNQVYHMGEELKMPPFLSKAGSKGQLKSPPGITLLSISKSIPHKVIDQS